MPGRGGKKVRRGKKNGGQEFEKIIYPDDDGQIYGQIEKMLGGCRFTVSCMDGKSRMCKVSGKMRKRVWMVVGDVVIVSLRDFQDGMGDIIHKYSAENVRKLKREGKIQFVNEIAVENDEVEELETGFDFDDI
jgi:translation initiation factor 1A